MFEHVQDRDHMISIIRHEIGHEVYWHVTKMVIMRILYYDFLFLGFTFLVSIKDKWLPMFGVTYNSLFLCMFIMIHFIHFKIAYYLYEVVEHAV
jgi:Zn-dependent protease with chaperone function